MLATLRRENKATVLCATHFHELTSFFDRAEEDDDYIVGETGSRGDQVSSMVVDNNRNHTAGASAAESDANPSTAATDILNMHASAHIDTSRNSITMLYEILPGPAERSYGIHVAKIAHFPDSIIEQAQMIEEQLLKANN